MSRWHGDGAAGGVSGLRGIRGAQSASSDAQEFSATSLFCAVCPRSLGLGRGGKEGRGRVVCSHFPQGAGLPYSGASGNFRGHDFWRCHSLPPFKAFSGDPGMANSLRHCDSTPKAKNCFSLEIKS